MIAAAAVLKPATAFLLDFPEATLKAAVDFSSRF